MVAGDIAGAEPVPRAGHQGVADLAVRASFGGENRLGRRERGGDGVEHQQRAGAGLRHGLPGQRLIHPQHGDGALGEIHRRADGGTGKQHCINPLGEAAQHVRGFLAQRVGQAAGGFGAGEQVGPQRVVQAEPVRRHGIEHGDVALSGVQAGDAHGPNPRQAASVQRCGRR